MYILALTCPTLTGSCRRQICRFSIAGFLLFASAQRVSAATWKFLVYGDSRSNNTSNPINVPILTELANQTLAENPEFVLFPGDLVYSGQPNGFRHLERHHAAGVRRGHWRLPGRG